MILPTKGISPQRALITIGGQVLEVLTQPRSINSTYESVQALRNSRKLTEPVNFDWFSLALVMLYSVGVVEINSAGLLARTSHEVS
jgi:hypothetical protein